MDQCARDRARGDQTSSNLSCYTTKPRACIFRACLNPTDGIYCPLDGSMSPVQMVFTWWAALHAGAFFLNSWPVPVVAHSYNAATNMFPQSAHASHSLSVIHPAAVLFIHLAGRRWGKELMCGTYRVIF